MNWKDQSRNRFSASRDANKWADIYSGEQPNVEAVSFRKRRDFAVNYVFNNVAEPADILDLGCGAGPALAELVNRDYNLIGVDYSIDMLQRAAVRLGDQAGEIPLLQADCENIPLPDSRFDCILCLGVISYAESIDKALSEQYRILKPGGICILSYRNKYNDYLMDPLHGLAHLFSSIFKSKASRVKSIGRSIPRSEILGHLSSQKFNIDAEFQTGFGNLRVNGKKISDGKLAITINNIVHRTLTLLGLKKLYRAMADVHVFVLKKPL